MAFTSSPRVSTSIPSPLLHSPWKSRLSLLPNYWCSAFYYISHSNTCSQCTNILQYKSKWKDLCVLEIRDCGGNLIIILFIIFHKCDHLYTSSTEHPSSPLISHSYPLAVDTTAGVVCLLLCLGAGTDTCTFQTDALPLSYTNPKCGSKSAS